MLHVSIEEVNASMQTALDANMEKIDQARIKENISILMNRYTTFLKGITLLSTDERMKLVDRMYSYNSTNKSDFCNAYIYISSKLKVRTASTIAFSEYEKAATVLQQTLSLIEKNLNRFFEERTLTIYNTKLSHAAVIGLLHIAELFINYTNYLFDGCVYEIVSHSALHELASLPRYRTEYILQNKESIVTVLNETLLGSASYLTSLVDAIKNNQSDAYLVKDNNQIDSQLMNKSINTKSHRFIQYGLGLLGKFFYLLGSGWNLIKNSIYQKQVKEKEWMESHVALLKLELHNVDPDSDEYRKNVKIIDAYNEMITELDKKIKDYEK